MIGWVTHFSPARRRLQRDAAPPTGAVSRHLRALLEAEERLERGDVFGRGHFVARRARAVDVVCVALKVVSRLRDDLVHGPVGPLQRRVVDKRIEDVVLRAGE
jgi:hypothetical protein